MFIKRFVLALAIATVPAAACSASDQRFFGYLNALNEYPGPVTSAGTGFALVTFSPTAVTMRVQVTFSGLTAGTTASHIHCCVTSTPTAGVATTLPSFTGFPLGVTSGTYDHTFDMTMASSYSPAFVTAQGTVSAALAALLAGMTNSTAYFNIHTSTYPAGEIRANMQVDTVFAGDFEQAAG